jgi:hypothetical protein
VIVVRKYVLARIFETIMFNDFDDEHLLCIDGVSPVQPTTIPFS